MPRCSPPGAGDHRPVLSESARATAASESRFRISTPNSRPRAVVVIALDAPSDRIAEDLAAQCWTNVRFVTASDIDSGQGRGTAVVEAVAGADLAVMIAAEGEDPGAADLIGEVCRARRVTTTALLMGATEPVDGQANRMRARLRSCSDMVVVPASTDYIAVFLLALRAEPQVPSSLGKRTDMAGARP